ncbi:MAG: hypothetical protein KDA57_16590, partial [Planctomycetales bacterium]|nr:hypothetical protein [Planctomycetales bacterium]
MVPETTIDSKIRYQPRDPSDDYKLVYDAWNRVVQVKDGFVAVQKNEYDGLNRRIERDETRGDGTKQHFYYNTQWQVLEIEVSRGTGPLAHYVYHP